MSDERDRQIRELLDEAHRSRQTPAFDVLFEAALAEHRGRIEASARRRQPLAWAPWAAAAAAAIVLWTLPFPRWGQPRPDPQRTVPIADGTRQAPDLLSGAMQSHLLYGRTDALLPSRTLLYASQPAVYLTYDPVTMEIYP